MAAEHKQLKGKTAIVTGGGGVLCGEMARALGKQGVKVAVVSRKLENAQAVADDIVQANGEAKAYACDVLDKKDIERVNEEIQKDYPIYDILINGAGGNHPDASTSEEIFGWDEVEDPDKNSFFDLKEEAIRHVFDLNFTGAVLSTQVFMKHMFSEQGSTVINISSMSAPSPMTKVMSYSAAKAGIENFTQWLAVHMAKENIRCNAIAPGFFLTNQNRKLLLDEKGDYTARSKKIMDHTPMERFGTPDDLLGTLLWLVDPEYSAFVTGITVPVDGGFMAYSGV